MNAKRIVSLLLAAVLAVGAFAGCSSKEDNGANAIGDSNGGEVASGSGEKTQIVLATWGGASEEGFREILKPFEEAYNVEIVFDIGNNSDRLNKLRANKDNPVIDVAFLTDGFTQIGNEEGLFEKIDPANVPNLDNLYDFAKSEDGYGPLYSVTTYGLVYNTELVEGEPTSWEDLWTGGYKVSVPDITSTAGPMLLLQAAELNGGGISNIDAGFEKMQELTPNVVNFYLSPTDVTTLFEREEIAMAPFIDIYAMEMEKSGLPIAVADTVEGKWAAPNCVNIVAGTKNKELCEELVNYILSKEAQEMMAEMLFEAPVNKDAVVSDELAQYISYGEEKVSSLVVFDWETINPLKTDWIDRWNREISA